MPDQARILTVDDDPIILESLCEFLRLEGYHADGAPNADRALELLAEEQFNLVLSDVNLPLVALSAASGRNVEAFKREVFNMLDVIRVYTKPPGKEPDLNSPFVLERGATVEDLAGKVHKDFLKSLRATKVWGEGVFDGQMVTREYVLSDGDVVEIKT